MNEPRSKCHEKLIADLRRTAKDAKHVAHNLFKLIDIVDRYILALEQKANK